MRTSSAPLWLPSPSESSVAARQAIVTLRSAPTAITGLLEGRPAIVRAALPSAACAARTRREPDRRVASAAPRGVCDPQLVERDDLSASPRCARRPARGSSARRRTRSAARRNADWIASVRRPEESGAAHARARSSHRARWRRGRCRPRRSARSIRAFARSPSSPRCRARVRGSSAARGSGGRRRGRRSAATRRRPRRGPSRSPPAARVAGADRRRAAAVLQGRPGRLTATWTPPRSQAAAAVPSAPIAKSNWTSARSATSAGAVQPAAAGDAGNIAGDERDRRAEQACEANGHCFRNACRRRRFRLGAGSDL